MTEQPISDSFDTREPTGADKGFMPPIKTIIEHMAWIDRQNP